MNRTATRVSRSYRLLDLLMLLFITMSFLYSPRICHAQITSFEYAYDRLIAEVFYNNPGKTQILGNPKQIDGTVYLNTSRGQVNLGKGPGWVFYFVDDSRQTTFYNVVLVSISGKVTRKVLKEKPLELDGYVVVDKARMAPLAMKVTLTSEEEAYNWLIHNLLGHVVGDRRIYVYLDKLEGAVTIETPKRVVPMCKGPGWLFFIDDAPMANWAHACRFVLVSESGEIQVERATWPPINIGLFKELTTPIPEPSNRIDQSRPDDLRPKKDLGQIGLTATSAANRWAVIISGGASIFDNHARYWNDASYFYQTLMNHGFLDNHIFVLISDGTNLAGDQRCDPWPTCTPPNSPLDLDDDGDNDTGFSATAANITTVFNQLAQDLDGDDILYIFTTDHGDSTDACPYDDPDSTMNLWNSTSISDTAFAFEVNKVNTLATVVIMEQCFSGGMLDDLQGDNRVLISAARFWELSWSGVGDAAGYDEFSYYMTFALDNPADADANEDDIVSMEEAYLYSLAHDSYQSEGISQSTCPYDNEGEHPSYFSNPWDLGRRISLYGIEENIPYNPMMARYSFLDGYTQAEVQETFPTGGTARNWSADDNFWQCNLPFSFPYGGQTYSTVWVDSNGIVYLNNPGSSNYENSVVGLKVRNAIAPLWDDLTTEDTGDDIYTSHYTSGSENWFTIRWQAHTVWDEPYRRPVNVAVKLSSDGAIRFLYGSGNDHTSRIRHRDKTIGISIGSDRYHLSLRNGDWDLGNAKAIEYLPYSVIYVDGNHSGNEYGYKAFPYNTISEGYDAIIKYGTVLIKGGSYTGPNNVPMTLTKPISVINYQGTAIIGSP